MAVPQTGSDPTASGHVPNTPHVTAATSVHEARAHLRATGEPAAVVYRGRSPVGVVTATALCGQVASGCSDMPVIAVMDYVTVPAAGYRDADAALRAINRSR